MKALRGLRLVPPCQQIITQLIQIFCQIRLEFLHVCHLVLVAGRVVEGNIKVIKQLLAGEPVARRG
jgi:hypothetical protein